MTDQSSNAIFQLAVFTVSARLSAGMSEAELLPICRATLQGLTPNEPSADAVAHDVALRGFHIGEDGMIWGLHDNTERNRKELVRLGNY